MKKNIIDIEKGIYLLNSYDVIVINRHKIEVNQKQNDKQQHKTKLNPF